MADTKLTALSTAAALSTGNSFYVVQGGLSRKHTGTQLLAFTQDGVAKLNEAQTFSQAQRTSITAGDNSIAFDDDNNHTLTATAANITVTNQTIGQSGTIIIAAAGDLTGWATEFDWGNTGVPTDLAGIEIFAYYISAASGVDSIKIGRV